MSWSSLIDALPTNFEGRDEIIDIFNYLNGGSSFNSSV